MEALWRIVAGFFAVAAIVGLILFARGPAQNGPHPAHPIAIVEEASR
jgi:hypothetical protein